jgi:tetratricopeptide (TPR) repeat protein
MKQKLLLFVWLFCQLSIWSQINTDRVLDNGRNALYFEDYVLSIQYFNKVISLKPHLVDPYYYRAIAKIQLEDYVGAEADCSQAIELNPFTPNMYYARGFARKRMGKYELAEADFDKALQLSTQNTEYMINRIEVYEQLKKFDKALADIEFLEKQKTKYTNLLLLEKGQILIQKGDTTKAYDTFTAAIKKDSTYAEFWSSRALISLLKKNEKDALTDYNRAVELKSQNISTYINRGMLNYQQKNYRGALTDYDRAVELDSNNIQALFNRGLLRSEVGDLNNAVSDLSKIIYLDEQNDEAHYQRALVSLSLKDYKQARQDFKFIIDKYPIFAPAYYGQAEVHEALGNKRQAAIDRYRAQQLMEEYGNKKHDKKSAPNTKAQIAKNQPSIKDKVNDFENLTDNSNNNNKYDDKIRGQIQNQHVDVRIKKNFVLSYYSPNDNLRQVNNYTKLVDEQNQTKELKLNLLLTNDEVALTQPLIETHFNNINSLTEEIKKSASANLYFERGINQALVLNMEAAVEDMTVAINSKKDFTLAYFCRANIHFKMLDFKANNNSQMNKKSAATFDNKDLALKINQIIQDYNRVLELSPDFAFAWFNRGNTYCVEKDYKNAIKDYTSAIAVKNNFAEAYFNRGLCNFFLNEKAKAIEDLSKAGELGIYQAYSLIKRFRDNQ